MPLNPHFQSSRPDTYARRLHFNGIDILARWDNIGSAENVPIIMDAATGCEARTARRASTLVRSHTGVVVAVREDRLERAAPPTRRALQAREVQA